MSTHRDHVHAGQLIGPVTVDRSFRGRLRLALHIVRTGRIF